QAAGRPAAPGERPDRHLLRDTHLPGRPGQVGPREPARHAAATAAGERAVAQGQYRVGESSHPPAPGRTPRERRLRRLPSADRLGGLLAGTVRRRRPLAGHGRRQAGRCRRGAARRQLVRGGRGAGGGTAQTPGAVRPHADGEALHLRPGPGTRGVRRAGHPQDRPRRAGGRVSILVLDPGPHHQHAFSDEEVAMIVTKKALSRRTFLRGAGAAVALPLLDAMAPSLTAQGKTPAAPERLRRLGYVYI